MHASGLIDPDQAAALLDTRDLTRFSHAMLNAAHSLAGVDELFCYRVGQGPPRTLASSSGLRDVAERAEAYARRFHRSDPALSARLATPRGSGFQCRVPADAIELDAYRKLCFEKPRFSEKICFGWRFDDHDLVVTFYHRHRNQRVDMAQLGALAQLAITALTRLLRREEAPPPAARLESLLNDSYPILTPRERQVCARTMSGMTARQIAADLELAQGTVLTYRQRAYQKLGVSRASQLLGAVLG